MNSEEERSNTIVTASAGTGKTYRLVSEFVDSKIHPRSILALTFTDKAAAEMRSRIAGRDPALERSLSSSNITTYHSFCAKILREYADRVGIDSRFSLLDPFEDGEFARKVAKRVVLNKLETNYEPLLSLVARLQLEGSDGTKGIVGHLIRLREQLIETGQSPQTISRIRANEPGRLEQSDAFQNALHATRRAIAAYDSVWSKLNENAKARVKEVAEAFEQFIAVFSTRTGVTTLEVNVSFAFDKLKNQLSGRFGPDDLRKSLVLQVSSMGTLLCESFLTLEEEAFLDLLQEFWEQLETEKKQHLCLGFSDLLVLTRRLLRDDLQARKQLKTRFQYVLVDEYQDTSPIQEDIVALLCETLDEEMSLQVSQKALGTVRLATGKLFVVGDPKQSIYGFRGADVLLFKNMAEQITREGGVRESLNLSRRSSNSVVQIVNAAVSCDDEEKLQALREDFDVGGAVLSCEDEALAITREVTALLSAQSQVAESHSFEPKDIAILVRRIKSAGPILRGLIAAGIPARLSGGEGFFERQEVIELISALNLALNPNDNIALLTVLRSPILQFPDFEFPKMFEVLKENSAGWTLGGIAEALQQREFESNFCARFEKFYLAMQSIVNCSNEISASEALELLLKQSDYRARLMREEDSSLCLANLRKLQDMVLATEGDFRTQIGALTQKMRRAPKEALGEEDIESNAVRIMTIHQSKGLEFPVVFLADTSAAIPSESSDFGFDPDLGVALNYRGRPIAVCAPNAKEIIKQVGTHIQKIRARQREKNESELSRLLYVALTRARDLIYFVDVQRTDKKAVDRGYTLRKLFFQGYDAHVQKMKQIMPVVSCSEARDMLFRENGLNSTPQSSLSLKEEQGEERLSSHSFRRLLYASDLLTTPKATDADLRAHRLNYAPSGAIKSSTISHTDGGRLAHRLIQLASEQLYDGEFENEENLREVLSAGLRLEGYQPSSKLDHIVENCIATLETVIWPLRKAGFEFRFEVPMQYESISGVIRGFADAVATRQNHVCIIDFKSSVKAVESNRTQLQLLAYCASVQQNDAEKQVFFAACNIGPNLSLDFEKFDEQQRETLDQHVQKLMRKI